MQREENSGRKGTERIERMSGTRIPEKQRDPSHWGGADGGLFLHLSGRRVQEEGARRSVGNGTPSLA